MLCNRKERKHSSGQAKKARKESNSTVFHTRDSKGYLNYKGSKKLWLERSWCFRRSFYTTAVSKGVLGILTQEALFISINIPSLCESFS